MTAQTMLWKCISAGHSRKFREGQGRRFYLYYRPSTATEYGELRLDHTMPDNWQIARAEDVEMHRTANQLFAELWPIVARLPLYPTN